MHLSFAALAISFVFLLHPCTAFYVEQWSLRGWNKTLSAHRAALPASKIFTTGNGVTGNSTRAGVCNSTELSIVNAWIAEANELHNAATTAYANFASDSGSRMLFSAWMGIAFNDDGSVHPWSETAWKRIGVRLRAVTSFLAGRGLPDPIDPSVPPWLFCGDAFSVLSGAWDPARDKTGAIIPYFENNDQSILSVNQREQQRQQFAAIRDVFPIIAGQEWAFYIDLLKGYTFKKIKGAMWSRRPDGTVEVTRLCDPGVYSGAVGPRQRVAAGDVNPNYLSFLGTFDRFIFLCPLAFNPIGNGFRLHSLPSLHTVVSYTDYPTPYMWTSLDRYLTLSTTLYHEIFHVTDSSQTSGDPFYQLAQITHASTYEDPRLPNNPESFVSLAMAAYIYQNPPATPAGQSVDKLPALFVHPGVPPRL